MATKKASSKKTAPELNAETVKVNANVNGEATNGTTRQGDESEITNQDSIKQNGITEVETTTLGNDNDTETDKNRSKAEVEFADEGNPDNKARYTGAGGGEFDQDGNPRTGGKSYGVTDDSNQGVSPDVFKANAGKAPDASTLVNPADYFNPEAGSDKDTNSKEWSVKDQEKLADSLSEPSEGIKAVVSTSAANYVRVKFYRNGLAFGTFKTRNFKDGDAKKFLAELKKEKGL